MTTIRRSKLLTDQWSVYPGAHSERINLLTHLLTVPVFLAGSLAVPGALVVGTWWLALAGLGAMLAAIGIQGRTHSREPGPKVTFAGPRDFATRILAEQWITFPRFVLTGAFRRAWRAAT